MTVKTLTRAMLSEAVAFELDLKDASTSKKLLNTYLETIVEQAVSGKRVLISQVGSIKVRHKNKRMARNPKNGDVHPVEARDVLVMSGSNVPVERVIPSQLILLISEKIPELTFKEIRDGVKVIVKKIQEVQYGEHRIELRGFGVFYSVLRPEYTCCNPATGEFLKTPAKTMVRFRQSSRVLKQLNS